MVNGTMAGYSGTPLVKKLGIAAGTRVALLGAFEGFEQTLGALPEGVRLSRRARGSHDVVVLFARSQADLTRRFDAAMRAMDADKARLWIAWPKKASGVATDLAQAIVQRTGLDAGLVDFKICAIDATWSGLCFGRRKA